VTRRGPWRVLGLDPTDDRAAIRRAYADKLRQLDIDRDVEGYTRLRGARDHALALARSAAVAEADAREPVLVDDGWEEAPAEAEPDAFPDDAADASPVPPAEPDEPKPPQILLEILFPQGETSEEPLTADELARAEQAQAAILAQAETSSIDEQAGIENWLAHHLASAWPRSAWLVEEAAGAFGWLDEAGQLGERQAVHFLNQRLKGMRFVAKVQRPSHPLHKAWAELSRPGLKGSFAFMRASKDDVQRLLAGIRERYPEVERHLDPERVGSWEATFEESPWSPWTIVWRIIMVVWVLSLVSRLFVPADSADPPIPAKIEWSAAQSTELFGSSFSDEALRDGAPDLSRTLDSGAQYDIYLDEPVVETADLLRQLRLVTLFSARDASFEELVAIKQLKLDLLQVAREQGGSSDCLAYARDGLFREDLRVDAELRDKERALAARLLLAGRLRPSSASIPTQAYIPGSVIEQIVRTTGFSEETVASAARGEGDDAVLCDYQIALLEAVLRRPGDVSEDLLRMM
jgi:hypothetical protein